MNPVDAATLMACRMAREVRDDDVVGVGLGTPLALAATLLARRTHAPRSEFLVAGALSPTADLGTCMRGAAALDGLTAGFVPHLQTMEQAERQAMTLQFLRPAEIDGAGNANTSRIVSGGELRRRLPGGLATADVFNILPRVVLYHTDHQLRALPKEVGFVTGAGGPDEVAGTLGPVRLITDRAVFRFGPAGPRLESVHPGGTVDEVLARTGFDVDVEGAGVTENPLEDELEALAEIDRRSLRELEFHATREAAARRLSTLH